jgi:hypothetical protein
MGRVSREFGLAVLHLGPVLLRPRSLGDNLVASDTVKAFQALVLCSHLPLSWENPREGR